MFVRACVSVTQPGYHFWDNLFLHHQQERDQEPHTPLSSIILCLFVLHFLCLSLLIPLLFFFVFTPSFPFPSLRESSDISRVCPALHSSAASEECLAAQLQLDNVVVVVGSAACGDIIVYTDGLS